MKRLFAILAPATLVAATLSFEAGCFNAASEESEHAPIAGRVTPTDSMAVPRAAHSATLLPNGTVLIAGGMSRSERDYAAAAEIYDPATDAFRPAARMVTPRASHTATLLPNGTVLIAGGYAAGYPAEAEIYDPATDAFTPTGSMAAGRTGHAATLLPNGTVLITGGGGVERYDPATGAFTPAGEMNAPRTSHTATLLADGRVLITGGHQGRRASMEVWSSAEIYDPAVDAFTPTGGMSVVRHKHGAARLADGRVLIAGGADERDGRGKYASAEIYDPATGVFTPTGPMHAARFKIQDAGVLLPDGRVLIAGGAPEAEVYDPQAGAFSAVAGSLEMALAFTTATLLAQGDVLIAGGYDPEIRCKPNAWRYRP